MSELQIVCGNRAGTWTVLLDENARFSEADLQGEMRPHFVVRRMSDVIGLLQESFDLQPPPHPEISLQEASAL